MNKDVWEQKPELLCSQCKALGVQQFLGKDCVCPVHGIVAPAYGDLEDHKPDPPKHMAEVSIQTIKKAKNKKHKTEDKPEKIHSSEEIKMMTDPNTFDDMYGPDDNLSIEGSWMDLAGDG